MLFLIVFFIFILPLTIFNLLSHVFDEDVSFSLTYLCNSISITSGWAIYMLNYPFHIYFNMCSQSMTFTDQYSIIFYSLLIQVLPQHYILDCSYRCTVRPLNLSNTYTIFTISRSPKLLPQPLTYPLPWAQHRWLWNVRVSRCRWRTASRNYWRSTSTTTSVRTSWRRSSAPWLLPASTPTPAWGRRC